MIPHPTVGLSLRLAAAFLAFSVAIEPAPADPTPTPGPSSEIVPVNAPDSISKRPFGKVLHGPTVTLYTLTNKNGMSVGIIDFGATVVSLLVPDRAGKLDNVALGFDHLTPYLNPKLHFGGTIGRYAGRIAKGRFMLDKVTYQVSLNDGPNSLHGGLRGFDKRMWNMEAVDSDTPAVRFSYLSTDGEEGYPGNLFVSVTYTLTEENELRVSYHATTDKTTVVNLTSHMLFNLAGADSGTILNEVLTVRADSFTPADAALIPTGEIAPVAGTPYDFAQPTVIGLHMGQLDDKPNGYDLNYVLNKGYFSNWAVAAILDDPSTGRRLEISTDQPGLQFYTGNKLPAPLTGKEARMYPQYAGLALETQHYPDSPNHDNFPSTILHQGDDFKSTTVYAFSTY